MTKFAWLVLVLLPFLNALLPPAAILALAKPSTFRLAISRNSKLVKYWLTLLTNYKKGPEFRLFLLVISNIIARLVSRNPAHFFMCFTGDLNLLGNYCVDKENCLSNLLIYIDFVKKFIFLIFFA